MEYELLLNGDKDEIKRFVKQAKHTYFDGEDKVRTDFSFQKFCPIPRKFEYGKRCPELSDWLLDNWGMEYDIQAFYDKKKQSYTFSWLEGGASSPFIAVSELFPDIKFTLALKEYKNKKHISSGLMIFQDGRVERDRKLSLTCVNCGHIMSV